MAERHHIETSLNELLRPEGFKDYGPNGLQVEGRSEVRLIVSGVTASLAFIDAALAAGADMLLVHHGLLPQRDPYLPRFERWIDATLDGLADEVRQPVQHFATWHHLRRIRTRAPGALRPAGLFTPQSRRSPKR